MASWMVHLRVADELLRRLDRIDGTAFVFGNMAPDSGVPNEDWTEFDPPYEKTHFKNKTKDKSSIDVGAFRERYLNEKAVSGYTLAAYSFFLGYYVHLLTDMEWSRKIARPLFAAYPEEAAEDRDQLIRSAKEDWYDLDHLYLEEHPDFRAFSLYENAGRFENTFMDMFAEDAFENRRRYICAFYRSGGHGDLHREYRYLTPERADAFVKETAEGIAGRIVFERV